MAEVIAHTASLVPDSRRLAFLPRWLGRRHYLRGELLVYTFAEKLSPDYRGGYWGFFECSNGAAFMAPQTSRTFATAWPDNYFSATLNAESFGIVASLFALGYLANNTNAESVIDRYHSLRDFACDHPDAGKILAAID